MHGICSLFMHEFFLSKICFTFIQLNLPVLKWWNDQKFNFSSTTPTQDAGPILSPYSITGLSQVIFLLLVLTIVLYGFPFFLRIFFYEIKINFIYNPIVMTRSLRNSNIFCVVFCMLFFVPFMTLNLYNINYFIMK